jgi:ATP adenylyltransferase
MTQFSAAVPAGLWSQVQQTTTQALASGALMPIATHTHTLADGGIPFVVRLVDSLARKARHEKAQRDRPPRQPANPFLPYEPALFVADLSPTHVCLLNKFNVVEHHLLVITRDYVAQESWLTLEDFVAWARCIQAIDGLGFYNSGPISGASQHHKHLQLVPFADDDGAATLPMAQILPPLSTASTPALLSPLPFQHRWQPLPLDWQQDHHSLGAQLHLTYRQLLADLGLTLTTPQPEQPYNLLLTRDWMMVVARSRPGYADIGVNSLGYAGWLLVKTPAELEKLRQIGPLNLLTKVGIPVSEP